MGGSMLAPLLADILFFQTPLVAPRVSTGSCFLSVLGSSEHWGCKLSSGGKGGGLTQAL